MLIVNGVFLPRVLMSTRFQCPYLQCKGSCCVVGDRGAPLRRSEIPGIEQNMRMILPELDEDAINTVKNFGFFEGIGDDLATMCIGGTGRCIFSKRDPNGVVSCYLETFSGIKGSHTLRPVSCRLFPIRVRTYNGLEIIDYEVWDECQGAWSNGPLLLDFCREGLLERFGHAWIDRLDTIRLNAVDNLKND